MAVAQAPVKPVRPPVGNSIKRRIETSVLNSSKSTHLLLPLGIPLKEGLKLAKVLGFQIEIQGLPLGIPLKEGLKPEQIVSRLARQSDSRWEFH